MVRTRMKLVGDKCMNGAIGRANINEKTMYRLRLLIAYISIDQTTVSAGVGASIP